MDPVSEPVGLLLKGNGINEEEHFPEIPIWKILVGQKRAELVQHR